MVLVFVSPNYCSDLVDLRQLGKVDISNKESVDSICVVGSIVLQSIETPYGRIKNAMGGSAVYFTLASRIFAPVKLVGVIGKDFPQEYIEILDKPWVDLRGLQKKGERSFIWAARYNESMDDRETLELELNEFARFKPHIPPDYRGAEYVFLAASPPSTQLTVLNQMIAPKFVLLDTVDFWIETAYSELLYLMGLVDAIVVGKSEAQMISGQSDPIIAGQYLLSMGPQTVVIKMGENGAIMISSDEVFSLPAYPCEVARDPTGAGDCFAGGLMGYMAKTGRTDVEVLKAGMVFGTIVASFCVEDFSLGRLDNLSLREIKSRLSEYKRFVSFDIVSEI